MPIPNYRRAALAAAGLLLAAGASAWVLSRPAEPRPALGLLTSLPIYWPEGFTVDARAEHWARRELERKFQIEPLDTLQPDTLRPLRFVLLAQPRPLSPAENVALDDWVRRGGRLLLLADPFLTEESRFGLGDRRRPQGTVLLSPILHRWGLELTFDDRQDAGARTVEFGGVPVPVRLAGRWRMVAPGASSSCNVAAQGVAARCKIGRGRVVAFADAAVMEQGNAQSAALGALTAQAFAP